MKLSDFLFKYDSNTLLMDFLGKTIDNPSVYVNIQKEDDKYIISPTQIFLNKFNVTKTIIELGLDFDILYSDCGLISCCNLLLSSFVPSSPFFVGVIIWIFFIKS